MPDEPHQPVAARAGSRPVDPTSAHPEPASAAETALSFGLVLLLTVLLCLWAAFFLPFRIGAVQVPVSLVVAGVGNYLLGRAGGRLLGVPGVLVPGALWLVVAVALAIRRAEGDLVITGGLVSILFLAVGTLGFAVAYGMTSVGRATARAAGPPGR